MSFGYRLLAWFLSTILAIILFVLAIDIGFVKVAGQPSTAETVLNKSGIYNSLVPGLLDQAKTISSPQGNIPLTDPTVRSAATSTLTPQYLQTNVNQALGSIYQWLNGQTSQPEFNFNLATVKSNFADKVAAGAKQKAVALPACTVPPTSTSYDVFSATCLPAGVSPDQVAAQARQAILGGQGFLDNTNIQANDLKANGSNQSVFADQLKNLPNGFRGFKKSPLVLAGLAIVFGALVILVYKPRLMGVRHFGWVIGGVGVFVALFGLGLNAAVSNKVISHIAVNNAVLQTSLQRLVHDLVHNLSETYILIGVIYIVIGAIAIVVTHYKQQPDSARESVDESPVPANPVTPAKKPAKKIKVQ